MIDKQNNTNTKQIYYRIAGATAILCMHLINGHHTAQQIEEALLNHPEMQKFVDIGPRYATLWNILFQIIYTPLVLLCDLSIVLGKGSIVPESIRKFRYTLLYGLVYPVGMAIAFCFWPYYLYDRELIFPSRADIIITPNQNLMSHGVVSLYVIMELALVPRASRKDAYNTVNYVICFNVLYVLTVCFTRYVDLGFWPYDILTVTEDSIFIYLVLAHPVLLTFFFYFTQWKTQDAISRSSEELPEKNL